MDNKRYLLYTCPHHAANLNNMRLNNKWCDVTIMVSEKVFPAHKAVLAASFKYFDTKFSDGLLDDVITIDSIKGADLEEFICYSYTGELLLTDSNALGLLEVANYLNETDIKKVCIEFLENHLNVDDALRAYKLGNDIDCHTLKNVARRSILSNFVELSRTMEYFDLNFENLKDLLVGVKFGYNDESQQKFFEGIVGWAMYDLSKRRSYIKDLLDLIDITKLRDLNFNINLENNVHHKCDYRILKDAVTRHITCSDNQQSTHQFEYSGQVLMLLGDVCSEPHIQYYNFTERKWSPLQQIPDANRMYSNSAILNNKLYYINRTFEKSHLQSYNLTTKESTRFYSSNSVLSWSSICACSNFLYLCGGKEFAVEFHQVLRFDPVKNSFDTLTPMKIKRSHAAAIVYQGYLHVLGGRVGMDAVTSLERYDAGRKSWTSLASMCKGRYGHAVAVLGEKLYACGGHDTSSVEVYDPFKNSWRAVASMKKERYHFFVVAHEGKLLAVGGDNEMTVEIYNPRKDEWEVDHVLSSGLQIFQPRGGFIKIYR